MNSLSEALTEIIASSLADQGLLLPEDLGKSKVMIASGAIKAEDWLLMAENALAKRDKT